MHRGFVLAIVGLLLSAVAGQNALEDAATDSVLTAKRNVYRVNYDYLPVSDSFNTSNPDYYQSMVMIALPYALFSWLYPVIAIAVLMAKYKANAFGGKKPKKYGYPMWQIIVLKVIVGVCVVISVTMSVMGWIGNSRVHSGVETFLETVQAAADNQTDYQAELETSLNAAYSVFLRFDLPAQTQLNVTMNEMRLSIGESQNATGTAVESGDQIELVRQILLCIAFIVALLASLAGILAIFLQKPKLSRAMAFCGIATIWLSFTALAIHIPSTVMLADLCVSLRSTLNNTSNSTDLFDLFIDCLPETTVASLESISRTLENLANNPATTPGQRQAYEATGARENLEFAINCGIVIRAFNSSQTDLCQDTVTAVDLCIAALWLIGVVFFFLGFPVAVLAETRFGNSETERGKKKRKRGKAKKKKKQEMDDYGWE